MNKKQLTIAWVITILICLTLISFPKKHLRQGPNGIVNYYDKPSKSYDRVITMPVTQWAHVTPICIALLLIGGVLICTLRDKKK